MTCDRLIFVPPFHYARNCKNGRFVRKRRNLSNQTYSAMSCISLGDREPLSRYAQIGSLALIDMNVGTFISSTNSSTH
jgi:hypothetical protein